MRIFVSIASEGIEKDLIPAKLIHELVLKAGHTHTNGWNIAFYSGGNASLQNLGRSERIKGEIIKSDLMLADISIPSFGVGYFVSLAKTYNIPIIFICHKKHKKNISKNFMMELGVNQEPKFYDDLSLTDLLLRELKKTLPRKKRMNFSVDQKYYRFLNAFAKEHHSTKTDILQELIEEKMEQMELRNNKNNLH